MRQRIKSKVIGPRFPRIFVVRPRMFTFIIVLSFIVHLLLYGKLHVVREGL